MRSFWIALFAILAAAPAFAAAPDSATTTATVAAEAPAPETDVEPETEDRAAKPHTLGTVKTQRNLDTYPLQGAKVYVLPIEADIMPDLAFTFHRMAEQARAEKADLVVLTIDTNGGDIESMGRIRDDIVEFDCPVIALIKGKAFSAGSLLALAADVIVMAEISDIGGAYPITASGEAAGEGAVEEKILSYTRGEWRKTAKARGHDPDIAQRMTDPKHEVPATSGYAPREGELLVLDSDQATSIGLAAFVAEDVDETLKAVGYTGYTLVTPELSWSEVLAGWMVNPMISSLLMLVAIGCFYVEFKTPGVGVPAALGVLALGLFFWGGLLADLANYWEVLIFAIGIGLLLVEIFVIPGFGVIGVAGLVFIFAGLMLSMAHMPTEGFSTLNIRALKTPALALSTAMIASAPMLLIAARFLPDTPLFRGLMSDPNATESARQEDAERNALPRYLNKTGVALTDLRPSGTVEFGNDRISVMTRGEYIGRGSEVKVIAEHGNEFVVALVSPPKG